MDFLTEINFNEFNKNNYVEFFKKVIDKYDLENYYRKVSVYCHDVQGNMDYKKDIVKNYTKSLLKVRLELIAYSLNLFINGIFYNNSLNFNIDDISEIVLYATGKSNKDISTIYSTSGMYNVYYDRLINPLFSIYNVEIYYHSLMSSIFFYDDNYKGVMTFMNNIKNSIKECAQSILFKLKNNIKRVIFIDNNFIDNNNEDIKFKTIKDYFNAGNKIYNNFDDYVVEYNYYTENNEDYLECFKLLKFNGSGVTFFYGYPANV